MADQNRDTIAAIATPPGRGGVGIIRVSGPLAKPIAEAILGKLPQPRFADYLPFLDQDKNVIDSGLALYFVGPNSFTGEDILELQGHGGPVVMDLLLQRVINLGARIAQPGEFSERAFLNDKVDLAQAEAIADLIEAGSEQAAKSAVKSLQGEFSRWIDESVEALTLLRIYVEAAIDFPEEEIDFLSDGHVTTSLKNILLEMDKIFASAQQGVLLRDGMRVVLIGQPNTGKSSLLNALAGRDSAIVTHIAGTTRDVLREEINIDGMPLHIIDTAGLRESDDVVEQEGIKRTWIEIEQADRALLLVDDKTGITAEDEEIRQKLPGSLEVTIVRNKIDLTGIQASINENRHSEIALSAKSGQGIDLLRDHLKKIMGYTGLTEGVFLARRRHLDALIRAKDFVLSGQAQLQESKAGELLAEDLRQAQQALGEITGFVSSDELLGKIFSSFCIGK
ncbi:MAG: tRNA uridine-5-carboxymethylaminomethyl(34) synthesis GTPase MnmE [Gammaproteobacteria bacterium]|nr:tRNA uridine-5-carboxymethylaminomethyl(34) synthesis GTPase MnmE [Gammaproteobacteria bacterium]MCW8986892.1 tRNA uridine-5-carboxymethylaminomethyl(34) synthesis GTPase MnmE [Gammaproteobacteria bacterium]